MKFIADLHIHSRHSIATSRKLDLEHLHIAAQKKGIDVVATGDITHPDWFQQVREQLVAAEPGMYRLNEESARRCDLRVPEACRAPVRFVLSTEISNVYKKAGRTRKNHNLVYLPDLDSVERLHRRLAAIGNIHSDGRPILGLDARDLLEIVLDTSDRAFLIPAHIWTPWFSVLGSKSGFDSLEACFDDLTPHIFAVETGLSSDPGMNWRVSFLDGITLVSNSDAHSPMKLGREANRFDTECTFDHIREALRSGDPQQFLGTYEFYPQEGKYHLDGHRKCAVCSQPSETRSWEGRCPKCGKPLTRGVLHRVEELADRPMGNKPEGTHPFDHLIPLEDVLGEILQVGTGSKKVAEAYRNSIEKLGNELDILQNRPIEDISTAGIPLLGEAIDRIRKKQVTISPGYDGAFGTIRLFDDDERKSLSGQRKLFALVADESHEPVSAPVVKPDGSLSAAESLLRPAEQKT
jgi:DNA helicase-2/ATP-dependent DNA helicase PcrA